MKRMRVGVLFGGRSGEHEVSLVSARSVMAALNPQAYEVVPIGITRDGRWLTQGDPMARLQALGRGESDPLTPPAPSSSDRRCLLSGIESEGFPDIDILFPVLHGPYGEDGTVQGLCEMAGLPYVGCGVLGSALAMDKVSTKRVLQASGIPVVDFVELTRHRWSQEPEQLVAAVEEQFTYPVFCKPAQLGSSVGITKARDRAELRAGLDLAATYGRKLLVERAVDAREIEVSVLGNENPQASIPGEIVPSREFYDYEAKYIDDRSELLIPAPLSEDLTAEIRVLAVRTFRALSANGMARVDFLLDRETMRPYLNEINTIPGFTPISMYPKLWEATELPYPQLLDRLIQLGLERFADRQRDRVTR